MTATSVRSSRIASCDGVPSLPLVGPTHSASRGLPPSALSREAAERLGGGRVSGRTRNWAALHFPLDLHLRSTPPPALSLSRPRQHTSIMAAVAVCSPAAPCPFPVLCSRQHITRRHRIPRPTRTPTTEPLNLTLLPHTRPILRPNPRPTLHLRLPTLTPRPPTLPLPAPIPFPLPLPPTPLTTIRPTPLLPTTATTPPAAASPSGAAWTRGPGGQGEEGGYCRLRTCRCTRRSRATTGWTRGGVSWARSARSTMRAWTPSDASDQSESEAQRRHKLETVSDAIPCSADVMVTAERRGGTMWGRKRSNSSAVGRFGAPPWVT